MLFCARSIIIILFFISTGTAYAVPRDFILKLAQDTISLSENPDEENQLIIEKNLEKIKELLQADLKNGKKEAPIDIYLFLNGILKNDLLSLQSLLMSSYKKNFPKDLVQFISESSAKKLSYASKENRIAQKTNISIKNISSQNNCQLYVNGYYFAQSDFISPAGVPFYIALYCEDNTFAIQRIQPEEAQKNLKIRFSEFKKITTSSENMENNIPNPNSKTMSDAEPAVSSLSDTLPPPGKKLFLSAGTGLAITQGFGEYSSQYISNLNLQDGAFVSSSLWGSFKSYIFSFETSQISFIEDNINKKTTYLKPAIGYSVDIPSQFDNIKLKNDMFFHYVHLIEGPENNSGYGLQFSIGPDFKIGTDGFLLHSRASLAYSFGLLKGFQLSLVSGIGYEF